MARGRQRDHTANAVALRSRRWKAATTFILLRRRMQREQATGGCLAFFWRPLGSIPKYTVSTVGTNCDLGLFLSPTSPHLFSSSQIVHAWSFFGSVSRIWIGWRMSTPFRWCDMEILFGKRASHLSEIFWEGIEHFMETRQHLITGTINISHIQIHAERYAKAMHDKSNALANCIGFIDGTVIGVARPGEYEAQNVCYNGHKCKHALKYQSVTAPDGLILHAYGPVEGRRHDWTLYGSNLSPAQRAFNLAMSKVRVTVEWVFKKVKLYWTTLDFKRKLRIAEAPVGTLYICGMLLTNMRNCIYPNTISQYFNCTPPTLEQYLSTNE
eukprot:IDg1528t1